VHWGGEDLDMGEGVGLVGSSLVYGGDAVRATLYQWW